MQFNRLIVPRSRSRNGNPDVDTWALMSRSTPAQVYSVQFYHKARAIVIAKTGVYIDGQMVTMRKVPVGGC